MGDEKDFVEEDGLTETAAEEPIDLSDLESVTKALETEKAKAEKYLANWKRSQADYINYKKRIEHEHYESCRSANAALIVNLLPVLDDFERAFGSLPPDVAESTWLEGINLIHRKLLATLEAQGVSRMEALGQPFDPAVHEAMVQAKGEEGKVLEELQKGYMLHDRVIRPALVVVGNGES